MDVVGILEAASLLVPEDVATGNDITVSDVWDYLAHDEWELALDLLQELGGGWAAPPGFWEDDGAPELDIARVWVEFAPGLPPGARAPVRLLPLNPVRWSHLAPGDRITLYECAVSGGTASILEVRLPGVQGELVLPC
ncbi:hypothetical protein OOK31_12160 [Streptomyces sp. NBC_00249]|uniref:hypothetical protein n=1 Tax=Streptomyces sp. NBC_00249 TaxID=2975690 RepID=UPI002254029A|nr:hypothetical protein [Streptomyces sp. NBC_00249]MCX5194640.1 hypothetical protein [Streptomyces sp. NBC_00249]